MKSEVDLGGADAPLSGIRPPADPKRTDPFVLF